MIEVRGRMTSLLALDLEFHPELRWRENVFLCGSILGITLSEVRWRLEDIVEFSKLGDALENPLRTYSPAMIARLGFSTLNNTSVDILLVEEILAVGYAEFQQTCFSFMIKFKKKAARFLSSLTISRQLEFPALKVSAFMREG